MSRLLGCVALESSALVPDVHLEQDQHVQLGRHRGFERRVYAGTDTLAAEGRQFDIYHGSEGVGSQAQKWLGHQEKLPQKEMVGTTALQARPQGLGLGASARAHCKARQDKLQHIHSRP